MALVEFVYFARDASRNVSSSGGTAVARAFDIKLYLDVPCPLDSLTVLQHAQECNWDYLPKFVVTWCKHVKSRWT